MIINCTEKRVKNIQAAAYNGARMVYATNQDCVLLATYTVHRLSKVARDAITLSGLPKELRIADLRRTGTTEMVEAGVSMGQIMSVTGHANPQSVKPYMKNTYDIAKNALTLREKYDI